MYYCGWDGGGSKTAVCVTDLQGAVIAENTFGPLNPNGAAPEAVEASVRDCVDLMELQPGGKDACAGLVIGLAGISSRGAAEFAENAVRRCGYRGKLKLTGDHEIALAGAIRGPGAILIAGTGSVCFGRDDAGRFFRTGGYGHLIGDEGGGFSIGRDILIAVTRASDGRGPATSLTAEVFRRLNFGGIPELLSWLYAPDIGKKQVASLAPLLLPALARGDEIARAIEKKAARELAELVTAAWKKAGMREGEIALAGGVVTHFDPIREDLETELRKALPQARVGAPRHSAAYGAATLARELFAPAPGE